MSASAGRQRTRAALTVTEVALAVVLLAASGLLVRSFAKLTAVDPGFDASNVVAGLVELPASKYQSADKERAAFDALLEKVRAIPGVEAATVSTDLPLNTSWQAGVTFEARPDDPANRPMLNATVVDPMYFATLRMRLVDGRLFSPADAASQPRVMLISASVASRFFAITGAIGQRMKIGRPDNENPWMTIVGVVNDTKTDGLQLSPRGNFYMPRAQEEMRNGWLMVRSKLPVERLTASLRRAVADVDPDVPLALTRTMESVMSELVEDPKFSMLLLTIFAAVALVLAAVGIYGVISYNVTQRSSEIGVRMALGAQRRDVLEMVVRQAMAMAAAGVAIGMLLALLGGQSLSSMLYGVGPRDPLVLASVSVFLLLVALTAAMAPAFRAARIDPVVAMRGD